MKSNVAPFPVGTIVTCQGKQGTVVEPMPDGPYTDGSTYSPECNDIVTYVRWEDGTVGWRYTVCLN